MLTDATAAAVSDATLIERSLTDAEAFGAIFDRHVAAIHRYIARRLGRSAADDLVADTFLTAFRRRADYRLAHPDARPWLYGIATNLVARHSRAEARRLRALAREPPGGEPVPLADEVAARVTAQGSRGRLAEALRRLPKAHRDVLLLHAWADLSYGEIALALDMPIGSVSSSLSRARQAVRAAVGGPPATREEPWTT